MLIDYGEINKPLFLELNEMKKFCVEKTRAVLYMWWFCSEIEVREFLEFVGFLEEEEEEEKKNIYCVYDRE